MAATIKQVWTASFGGGEDIHTTATTGLGALRQLAATIKATVCVGTLKEYTDEDGCPAVFAEVYVGQDSYEAFASLVNIPK